MTTTPTAPDPGQGTAATAADEGKRLGGVAAEEAQSVASDVKQQAQHFLDDTMQQVNEQSSVQRDRLVELLRSLSHDLSEMAGRSDGSSLASQLVRQGADRAETVGSKLDGREPADLVNDVRAFARRRPAAFLAGALVAGVAAGRFARGAKEAQSSPDLPDATRASGVQANRVPQPMTGPLDPTRTSTGPVTPTAEASTSPYQTASTGDPALGGPYTDAR